MPKGKDVRSSKLKVIKVPKKNDKIENMVKILEDITEGIKNGEIRNFIAAGFSSDGNILTAYGNSNFVERHTLISYLSVDLTRRISQLNISEDE